VAKNRGNKRKKAGKLTRNQKRKAEYAAKAGWDGKKAAKKKSRVRVVGGTKPPRRPRPTACSRACRQCYPGGVFRRACPRGERVAA